MSGSVTISGKEFKPLIGEERIREAVEKVAKEMNKDLAEKFPLFLSVLNGSFMFASDLMKNIKVPCEISFIRLASYTGTRSSGEVKEVSGLDRGVKDRTVVIVEDIVDSGLTVEELRKQLIKKAAREVKIATFLFKPQSCRSGVKPDYVGFETDDRFVIGYGMDYEEQGRNLKEVYVLVE